MALLNATRLFKVIRHPARYLQHTRRERAIDRALSTQFFADPQRLDVYTKELRDSGLIDTLAAKRNEYKRTVRGVNSRGRTYGFGTIDIETGMRLFSVVREFQPEVAVETGVCNGFSTAFMLMALRLNQKGRLYSIDFPEVAGTEYREGTFWEGKGRSAIPQGSQPGWLIPAELRDRWELTLGKSQEKLPELLGRLGQIDFFIHDSEHSYDCMWFEYSQAYQALRRGGLLASDDINWNDAFYKFAKQYARPTYQIGQNTAFFLKD
jgi:predicted O-methyltransferase YrrM